jgi:hypothetical protein
MKEPTGIDISIQVIESEIFDFDRESAPMVKVLVNSILEEAKLEAWNEGETEYLKKHRVFMDQKEAERLQKMRDFEKNERHKRHQAIALKRQRKKQKKVLKETHCKLIGRQLSKNYIRIIHSQVAERVAKMGFQKEERASDQIQNEIMTQVEDLIYQQMGQKDHIEKLVQSVLQDAKKVFSERFKKGRELYKEYTVEQVIT